MKFWWCSHPAVLAVEALDDAILMQVALPDQLNEDSSLIRPLVESARNEFVCLQICSNNLKVTPKRLNLCRSRSLIFAREAIIGLVRYESLSTANENLK